MSPARPIIADVQPLPHRRRLLRSLLGLPLLMSAAVLAGCANRQPLPPERRTRGRFGNRDGPGRSGR